MDSIGINTHSGFGTGSYNNSAMVIDSLKYIGVDLVRDTFVSTGVDAPVLSALAAAGIKFDFVTSSDLPAASSAALTDYVTALRTFLAVNPGSISAIEGINEANIQAFSYNGSSSMAAAGQFQAALFGAVKADAALAHVPVYNLTLGLDSTADYKALGNLAAYSDYANVHAYTNTSNSADATMEYSIALAKAAAAGDPLVVTETGYTTLQSSPNLGVSELAQAKLVLDNLLNAYQNGASKTFLYELFDTASTTTSAAEQHFGIFNEDGTPKIAAIALHNLTTILSYQGAPSETAAPATLSNLPSNAHSMTMTKAGGIYDIVLWTDKTVWNDKTDSDIGNAPTSVSVSLGSTQAVVYVYNPLLGTAPIAVYHNVSEIKVPLSDSPLIVEIGSNTAVVDASTHVAGHLTMTAAELVTTIGTLESATGLQSITLTGGSDLHVSSAATMQYMIVHDKETLSKIQGNFTFSVSYGQPTWQETQTFTSAGKLVSTTDAALANGVVQTASTVWADGSTAYNTYKSGILTQTDAVAVGGIRTITAFDASGKPTQLQIINPNGETSVASYLNGVVTNVYIHHADGTNEFQNYNVTGASYTTQIQKTDAKGAVFSVVRSHADGSLDYTAFTKADGSKIVSYYDATGHLRSQVANRADGSLISSETDAADGSKTINTYDAAGHKVANLTVTATGTSTTSTYDTAGHLTQTSVKLPSGETTTTVYTNGVKTLIALQHADGTSEFQNYQVTGASYTTQIQKVGVNGVVYSVVRAHADGSLDYTELHNTDGSQVLTYYDATGHKKLQATTEADGDRTTLSYNAAGQLTHVLAEAANGDISNSTYSNGIKTNTVINHADHTNEFQAYNLTGTTYTTQIQKAYANGFVFSVVRTHADGSLDYTEVNNIGGTKVLTYYDATGHKLTQATTDVAGNHSTLSYNQAGMLTRDFEQHIDGSTETTAYTNGAKTTMWVLHADGSRDTYSYNVTGQSFATQRQSVDAHGNFTSIERDHADGTLDYTKSFATDGTTVATSYNATGHAVNTTTVHADKTKEVTVNLQDGTGDVRHESYSSANVLQKFNVAHQDGTTTAWALTNSQTMTGGRGNDTFYLYADDEKIQFTGGHDKVYSFDTSAPTTDHIVITNALAHAYSDLNLSQSGGDVLITVDHDNSILLTGTQLANVHSDMFLFA
ncbi:MULTISPECIES: hypothetical protein [unclassified Rhizobium]|uniref:hypothetical protein n=1 Tax=unclassified Rhizobium TaxID=2613769 RepID=UPI0011603673|nr:MULTISPECIES: hypothetical protein [unclassified Rhizobium]TQX85324.1 hypothetical protein EQW76_21510 [Rhizobium sp. rho-13.1]TQY09871.1 hypothetical protein EQW74_21285 [Rhizobium sp. rho-1.1]